MSFYESTDQVAILRERLRELSRIRSGFATHLGSSLYEATKDDEELRWGRESLYDGIAMCDEERERVLKAIAEIELGLSPEPPAASVVAEPEVELEETVVFEQVAPEPEVPEAEAFAEVVEVEVEPEP
ncbi:MAG: hypothetical protein Q4B54_04685, partial [Coriobacteriales bacterium]|nr:hypothetical protein [Coriobacteriales bacterium]